MDLNNLYQLLNQQGQPLEEYLSEGEDNYRIQKMINILKLREEIVKERNNLSEALNKAKLRIDPSSYKAFLQKKRSLEYRLIDHHLHFKMGYFIGVLFITFLTVTMIIKPVTHMSLFYYLYYSILFFYTISLTAGLFISSLSIIVKFFNIRTTKYLLRIKEKYQYKESDNEFYRYRIETLDNDLNQMINKISTLDDTLNKLSLLQIPYQKKETYKEVTRILEDSGCRDAFNLYINSKR